MAGRTIQLVVALLFAVTVLSFQVSGRHLSIGGVKQSEEFAVNDSYASTEYKDLEEIDRLKLSINKLICDTMEEECEQMDDSEDHREIVDQTNESFATLNVNDHVREA